MIVKLDKNSATTEGTRRHFHFGENEFIIWTDRRKKVKFLGIKHYKIFNFSDMLILSTRKNWDTLRWYKKQ